MKTYREYLKAKQEVEAMLPKFIGFQDVGINHHDGGLEFSDTDYTPDEAVKLAYAILDFYDPDRQEVPLKSEELSMPPFSEVQEGDTFLMRDGGRAVVVGVGKSGFLVEDAAGNKWSFYARDLIVNAYYYHGVAGFSHRDLVTYLGAKR
jgi:hypothetical protein